MAADVNLDGTVSLADLGQMQRNFGMTERALWTDGDLNADGRVDRADAVLLARNYGSGLSIDQVLAGVGEGHLGGQGGMQAVPEPSTAALAACAGLAMAAGAWRRRAKSRPVR
jgi:hypothetical protein